MEAFAELPTAYNRTRGKDDPAIRPPILYGRVDLIPSASGPRVGEFELVEPELFFRYRQNGEFAPLKPALDKFIQGIEETKPSRRDGQPGLSFCCRARS